MEIWKSIREHFFHDFLNQVELAEEHPNLKHSDKFLNRLGYGPYQKRLLFFLIILFLADGCELIIISIVLPSMTKEWALSSFQRSLVASIVFLGILIGSFISPLLADKFGRKNLMLLGSFSIAFFGLTSAYATIFSLFLSLRFLVGFGIGIITPVATSLTIESIPTYYRSFYLNNLWICFPVGHIFISVIGMLIMPNLEVEKWQTLVAWAAIPAILGFIFMFFIYESPRFLITNNKIEEGFAIFNKMGAERNIQLTEEEKEGILQDMKEAGHDDYSLSYVEIFKEPFTQITIMTWLLWYGVALVYYGALFTFPQILMSNAKDNKTQSGVSVFKDIIITSLIYSPFSLVSGYISELKFFGRKYSMAFGFGAGAIFAILAYSFPANLPLFNGFMEFGVSMSYIILPVYGAEVYPTKIRTLGIGSGYTVTRLGGITAPYICEFFFAYFNMYTSYILFFLVAAACSFICHKLPYETHQTTLDNVDNMSKEMGLLKSSDFAE